MTESLTGRIAVITGGGSGLGAALARVFAEAGMSVAVLDINEAGAQEVAKSLTDEFTIQAIATRVDIGDSTSVSEAAEYVRTALGGCDVLCANVGVQQFGSASVLAPGISLAAYQTSKFAVMGFGETLREELAADDIGVTVLFPDGMITDHLQSSARARPAELGESTLNTKDIDAMLAHRTLGPADIVTPEHAVRNVLADLRDNVPYSLTHGSYRPHYNVRRDALEAAFDRMESS